MDFSLGIMIHHLHRIISREQKGEYRASWLFQLRLLGFLFWRENCSNYSWFPTCFQYIKTGVLPVISIRKTKSKKKIPIFHGFFLHIVFSLFAQCLVLKNHRMLLKSCVVGDWGHLHSFYSSTILKLILKVTFLLKT